MIAIVRDWISLDLLALTAWVAYIEIRRLRRNGGRR